MHCWLEHAEKLPSKNCLEQVSIRQQDRAVAGCPIQSDSSKQYSRRVEWSQLDRVRCASSMPCCKTAARDADSSAKHRDRSIAAPGDRVLGVHARARVCVCLGNGHLGNWLFIIRRPLCATSESCQAVPEIFPGGNKRARD